MSRTLKPTHDTLIRNRMRKQTILILDLQGFYISLVSHGHTYACIETMTEGLITTNGKSWFKAWFGLDPLLVLLLRLSCFHDVLSVGFVWYLLA